MLAYPNCSVSSLICPIDSLGVANTWLQSHAEKEGTDKPLFSWDIVTPGGKPVAGFGGIPVHPHRAMEDIQETDVVLIPGFIPPMEFIGKVSDHVKTWLCSQHERKTLIGTICTGTFLLAETGLLDGREGPPTGPMPGCLKNCTPRSG